MPPPQPRHMHACMHTRTVFWSAFKSRFLRLKLTFKIPIGMRVGNV